VLLARAAVLAAAALVLAAPALAAPPRVQAPSYLVENVTTGDVLAQYAAGRRRPIASITKLMTVIVTLQNANPSDVVTVRTDAAEVGESTIHLRAGEKITVRQLIEAALIQSANDAADALADFVGRGDAHAFVALMNAEARRLGMKHTHFVRPDGLDVPGHVSSARDVLKLARAAMRYPLVRQIVRRRTATISGGRRLYTWNDLLGRFPGLLGVKTGHTGGAGWCQVAAARGRGSTTYAVVLGEPTRSQRNVDLAALLRWGISRYRLRTVIAPRTVFAHVPAGYGRSPLELVVEAALRRPVRVDRPLVAAIAAPGVVSLPLRRGQHVGEVRVTSGDRVVGVRALVAARSVSRPSFFGRVRWYTGRTFSHIGGWFT
jgi:serine-type D-Ala-D-Ala carboxypeptidase (penicillin-binding protein 5/6)